MIAAGRLCRRLPYEPIGASMKRPLSAIVMLGTLLATSAAAQTTQGQPMSQRAPLLAPADVLQAGAPALGVYTDGVLGELWQRSDLTARDRAIVTLAALVAGGNAAMAASMVERALDVGVKPAELNEIIAHLAFYTGWPNAVTVATTAKSVFAGRGIGTDQLTAGPAGLTPETEAKRQQRTGYVRQTYEAASPALVEATNDVLFGQIWRRPGLTLRDRSLVTISALIADGKSVQLAGHLNRALDNGLTRAEASAVIAHLAFYAGWPNAVSAATVAKGVFEKRPS